MDLTVSKSLSNSFACKLFLGTMYWCNSLLSKKINGRLLLKKKKTKNQISLKQDIIKIL